MTRNLSAAVLAISLLAVFVPVTQAAGGTLYVDGKSGSDSDNGLSAASAFKTIAKAASKVPTGSAAAGWTVIVKGYTDYVYRERAIPTGWDRHGTPSSRIVFRAAGYVAGSSTAYVKPIVSGADRAPASGQRWSTTSTAGVWRTPWATAPFDYGKHKGSIKTALFQNGTTWLWEQTSLSALASRAATGKGGYWYDAGANQLYVSAVGSPSSGANNPDRYSIDVIMRATFYFMGTNGVAAVEVRGFDVRHSANGISLAKGVDHSVIADTSRPAT